MIPRDPDDPERLDVDVGDWDPLDREELEVGERDPDRRMSSGEVEFWSMLGRWGPPGEPETEG